jgi:hypothetical protein
MRAAVCLQITLVMMAAIITQVGQAAGSAGAEEGAVVDRHDAIRLSEPVQVTATHEVFGAPMNDANVDAEVVGSLAELIGSQERYLGSNVRIETRIARVCQKKGCFFIAQEGDLAARVTFKDYGFFIPTDSAGKVATLEGTFTRHELARAEAEHLAEDLGEPTATTASLSYEIVASSIRIPR